MLKSKHNDILEELLYEEGHSHIIEIRSLNQDRFFDQCGKLLAEGRIQFWKELDHIMKEFDRNKAELLPRRPNSSLKEPVKPQKHNAPEPIPSPAPVKKSSFYHMQPRRDHFNIDNRPFRPFNRMPMQSTPAAEAHLSPRGGNNQSYYGRDMGFYSKKELFKITLI